MKYFDVHLHLPSADVAGLDRLRRHADEQVDMVGGLLVLNTPAEVSFAHDHFDQLPSQLSCVPYYSAELEFPAEIARLGWYKIHPNLHKLDRQSIAPLVEQIAGAAVRPRGLMVHCFPWGPNLDANISLPLVIALAQAMPEVPILATHGGGYESWAFRAHTGSLPNVLYDFSVTMAYYRDSDLLRPFGIYARSKPARLLFGSDWPWAEPLDQLAESIKLAEAMGICGDDLARQMLDNARQLWPRAIETSRDAMEGVAC